MSNFQLVRYKASDSWVPETDIDGVDANETVVAEANNVEFSNGFFENTIDVNSVTLPSGVLSKLNQAYIILSAKKFKHSSQGEQTVYILWKELTSDLIIYLNDILMTISDGASPIVYLAKPENISYNLVNDQLKINLNVTATYSAPYPAEPVIMNLALTYLPKVIYVPQGTFVTEYARAEGWYLTPRWLGWQYQTYSGSIITDLTRPSSREYTFETSISGTGGNTGISEMTDMVRSEVTGFASPHGGSWFLKSVSGNTGYFTIINADAPTLLRFYAFTVTPTSTFIVRIFDTLSGSLIKEISLTSTEEPDGVWGHFAYEEFVINIPYYAERTKVDVTILNTDIGWGLDDVRLEFGDTEEFIVVAKYFDGQRGIIYNGIILSGSKLRIPKPMIDWRIVAYEVYHKINGLSVLVNVINVPDVARIGWAESATYVEIGINYGLTETTLNFNYNLPATARVDNQRYIYSEIVHKGRVYFVNGDYKVYQSHISSNLAIQADAFPYDEETGFGYFIVDHSKTNLVLANSPTNDMVIITSGGLYIYFIQPSGSGTFKQLKMGSGNITISSTKTLTSLLNGEPATDGLFWIDNNGIYFYGGGMASPENLITLTHLRYWQAIPQIYKNQAVGFYNPTKKEYWLCIANEFLIFELSFKKFRRLTSVNPAVEFMGYQDLIPYYMASNIAIVSCDGSTRLAGQIDSHYNTIEGNPEVYHKILQELYLEFGTSDSGVNVTMQVLVDDWVVATYLFNSSKRFDKWLSPAGVRFNRIKLKVFIPGGNYIRIKEFGFSYSPDLGEPLGIVPVSIATSGYGFDYGNDYGNPPI